MCIRDRGIWDTPEAKTCFDIVAKLASYTNPITPAQANDQDFTEVRCTFRKYSPTCASIASKVLLVLYTLPLVT